MSITTLQRPETAHIEPRWWTGTPAIDPTTFTIDASSMSGRDLRAEARATFDRVGLVHIVNTGLATDDANDLEAMRTLARAVINDVGTYAGGANPRDPIAPNVYEVGAPLGASLQYHHEMAYVGHSHAAIGFLCLDAIDDSSHPLRGATFVSDSIAATDELLDTPFGRKLRDLGVCYIRNLTDRDAFRNRSELGVYNHWQKSFDTDDPIVAETRARAQGLSVRWDDDATMRTRYYAPAFEYHAASGRNVLYSSLADHGMWFDTWPGISSLPHHERPLDMTFGDDTRFSHHERQQWIDLYDTHGTPICWRTGDVAIVCNYRFAHGRQGIHLQEGEARTLGVVLGEPYERMGVRPDAW